LIVRASERTQVVVVSHAWPLIDALTSQPECHSIVLAKNFGQTRITSSEEQPAWEWPAR
jgi:predicted ATPase